jgi:phage baseplate assembly protein W
MVGMNRHTGKPLGGWEHVVQSVADILTTPPMTRVWRREYGGTATYLVDKPALTETLLSFTLSLGDAINKWEPRYRLRRCWFEEAGNDGVFIINIDGTYYPRGHLGDFETGVRRGLELPLPTGFYISGRP